MASFMLTRKLLARLAAHEYTPQQEPLHVPASTEPELKSQWRRDGRAAAAGEELVCRVCAGSGCTPLRETLGDCDIMSAVCSVTGVTMSIEDRFPKYICTVCLELLRSALELRRTCQASDRKFRSALTQHCNLSTKNSYPYSRHNFQLMLHQMKLKRIEAAERREKANIKRTKKKKQRCKKEEKATANKFTCKPCNLPFPDKERLVAHRARRACVRHPCHICGQLVLSLRQHVRVLHGQPRAHKCHVCGKEFPIVARLRSHQLVHTNTFSFHCDMCPYKSKHKYYLVMHMRTHTGEKPYKCNACDATFVNPSNLNKHRLTHREKQFQCTLCEKSFRTSTALREHHEAAHMNLKHTCKYCGRDFCYKSDLRKHEIRYHNRVKKDYIGGEPTYKQVERMTRATDPAADPAKGSEVAAAAAPAPPAVPAYPQTMLYAYPLTDAYMQPTLVTETTSTLPLLQASSMLPDLPMKKDDPKLYASQNNLGFFYPTESHRLVHNNCYSTK